MADMGEGVVPSEGVSPTSGVGADSPLSFLNAEWINDRIVNVQNRVNALLDRLIDDGLLGSGYFPFDMPVTDAMLAKMTPKQFRALYDSMTDLEQKSHLLERVKGLKLPPIELMPFAEKARYPVPKPVAGGDPGTVESSATV